MGRDFASDDGIVAQFGTFTAAHDSSGVGNLAADITAADATIADGRVRVFLRDDVVRGGEFHVGTDDAGVCHACVDDVIVDDAEVADGGTTYVGEEGSAISLGDGHAVAYDVSLTVEGAVLDVVVVAQDGELIATQVDVALQIDIEGVAFLPEGVVHVPGIAGQLGGVVDVDALLLAFGAQLVVHVGAAVPEAVAVGCCFVVGANLLPGAHVGLVGVGRRCARHGHKQREQHCLDDV